jgi:hypothetical protein
VTAHAKRAMTFPYDRAPRAPFGFAGYLVVQVLRKYAGTEQISGCCWRVAIPATRYRTESRQSSKVWGGGHNIGAAAGIGIALDAPIIVIVVNSNWSEARTDPSA